MSSRIFSVIGTALTKVGVWAQLFTVVREGGFEVAAREPDPGLQLGWLGPEDLERAHALEPWRPREQVESWFGEGQLIFGVKDGEHLVGRTVCDLKRFSMNGMIRPLENDEVYLHSACVDPAYRGRGIAPLMRGECYRALRKEGYRRFYSVTKFFNAPARRFKEKLGAVEERLLVYFDFFHKWYWTFTLPLPGRKANTGSE